MKARKSNRLKKYDYSEPGSYFITVCVQDHKNVFGQIEDRCLIPNEAGRVIESLWKELPFRFANIELDEFIVMPNHFHGMIVIKTGELLTVGAGSSRPLNDGLRKPLLSEDSLIFKGAVTAPLQPGTLGQMVAFFKYQSTKQINALRRTPGLVLWQRNYYERVVRNEKELYELRRYIQENPAKWDLDPENAVSCAADCRVLTACKFSLESWDLSLI